MSDRIAMLTKSFAPSCLIALLLVGGFWVGPYPQYVIAFTMTSIVAGAGLAMLVGYARCITLASGAMLAIGAYSSALLALNGVPFLWALLAAVAFGLVAGLLLGVPSVRFRSHNLAMVTLVFQAVVILLIREFKTLTGGAEGLRTLNPNVFGISISSDVQYLVLIALAAIAVLPLISGLLLGAFGKNLRALASNEVGSRAFGISVEKHLIVAFVISSGALAFAGALNAPRQRIIDPDSFGIILSIFSLAGPIVGGLGSLWGGIVGAATMRLLPEFLRPVADYTELVLSSMVVLTIIFMPKGIVGTALSLVFGRKAVARTALTIRSTSAATPAIRPSQSETALVVENLSVSYGAVKAVDDVSIAIPAGSIFGLMGPNGAGKTTLLNAVSGFVTPRQGGASLFGKPLLKMPIHHRIGNGVSRTFQQVAIFPTLSCRDNVIIGLGHNSIPAVLARSVADVLSTRRSQEEARQANEALESVGLREFADLPAKLLSLGNQRRLEIARAIVSRPKLILLDEPVSGVSDEEIETIAKLLRRLNRELGVTMMIVEHNISFLLSLSDYVTVLGQGRVLAQGTPDVVVRSQEVRHAYFGEERSA